MRHAINGMPFHKKNNVNDEVNRRRSFINLLYEYLSKLIDDDILYEKTIKDVTNSYINYSHPFELNLDTIYNIHINVINHLFNKYLFKKYNITEDYNIKVEDTFLAFTTVSLVNFKFVLKPKTYYHEEYYDIDLNTRFNILIPDNLKLDTITAESILQLNEVDFSKFKRQYETFYIKYNKLIDDIKNELNELINKCCFSIKIK
jgi:hypothetical protein